MFSLLAPWIGGAGSAVATGGGMKSMLAPWLGGAGVPAGSQAGFHSMVAFWVGGGGGDGGVVEEQVFRGYPPPSPQMMGVTVN